MQPNMLPLATYRAQKALNETPQLLIVWPRRRLARHRAVALG